MSSSWCTDDSTSLSLFESAVGEKTPEDKKFGMKANKQNTSSDNLHSRLNISIGRKAGMINSSNNFNNIPTPKRTAGNGDSMIHITAPPTKTKILPGVSISKAHGGMLAETKNMTISQGKSRTDGHLMTNFNTQRSSNRSGDTAVRTLTSTQLALTKKTPDNYQKKEDYDLNRTRNNMGNIRRTTKSFEDQQCEVADFKTRSTRNSPVDMSSNDYNNIKSVPNKSRKFASPIPTTPKNKVKKPNEVIDLLDSEDDSSDALLAVHGVSNDRNGFRSTLNQLPLLQISGTHAYLGLLSFQSDRRNQRMEVFPDRIELQLEDTSLPVIAASAGAATDVAANADRNMEEVEAAAEEKTADPLADYPEKEVVPFECIDAISFGIVGHKEDVQKNQKGDMKVYGKNKGDTASSTELVCNDQDIAFVSLLLKADMCLDRQILKSVCVGSGFVLDPNISNAMGKINPTKFITFITSQSEALRFSALVRKNLILVDKIVKKVREKEELLIFPDQIINVLAHTNRENFYRADILAKVIDDSMNLERRVNRRQRGTASSRSSAVSDFTDPEDCKVLLVYPVEVEALDAITIHKGDLRRLEPCVYLNDNLIDLRVKNLVAKLSDERRKKIHAFSCLFYGKLTEVNDGGKAAHSLVSRWTKSLDLFSLDFVLIPINFAMHWSLCVLVRPGELLRKMDRYMTLCRKTANVNSDKDANKENQDSTNTTINTTNVSQSPALSTEKRKEEVMEVIEDTPPSSQQQQEEVKEEKEEAFDAHDRCCLLFMDSLGMHNAKKIGDVVKSYLFHEWEMRKKNLVPGAAAVPTLSSDNIKTKEEEPLADEKMPSSSELVGGVLVTEPEVGQEDAPLVHSSLEQTGDSSPISSDNRGEDGVVVVEEESSVSMEGEEDEKVQQEGEGEGGKEQTVMEERKEVAEEAQVDSASTSSPVTADPSAEIIPMELSAATFTPTKSKKQQADERRSSSKLRSADKLLEKLEASSGGEDYTKSFAYDLFTTGILSLKPKVPHQPNGYDCGVYVIKYVEQLLLKWPTSTSQDLIDNFQSFFCKAAFTQHDVDQERIGMKLLLEEIHRDFLVARKESDEEKKREKDKKKEVGDALSQSSSVCVVEQKGATEDRIDSLVGEAPSQPSPSQMSVDSTDSLGLTTLRSQVDIKQSLDDDFANGAGYSDNYEEPPGSQSTTQQQHEQHEEEQDAAAESIGDSSSGSSSNDGDSSDGDSRDGRVTENAEEGSDDDCVDTVTDCSQQQQLVASDKEAALGSRTKIHLAKKLARKNSKKRIDRGQTPSTDEAQRQEDEMQQYEEQDEDNGAGEVALAAVSQGSSYDQVAATTRPAKDSGRKNSTPAEEREREGEDLPSFGSRKRARK